MTNAETSDKGATATEQDAKVTSGKTFTKRGATRTGKRPKAARPKKGVRAKRRAKRQTKGGRILDMITRAQGATLAEIMKATGWQAHSVRGFLSTAPKKCHITIESSKSEAGERTYRVVK